MTYEYALIQGINDSKEDARRLGVLLGKGAHVNLIPLNSVRERKLFASKREIVLKFQSRLLEQGINATIRKSMGADIDSACGQLRSGRVDGI